MRALIILMMLITITSYGYDTRYDYTKSVPSPNSYDIPRRSDSPSYNSRALETNDDYMPTYQAPAVPEYKPTPMWNYDGNDISGDL